MKRQFRRLSASLAGLVLCALLAPVLTASAAAPSDVPAGFWAEEDIRRCVEQGYFYLEGGSLFGVGKEMTRAEFVVVLCRFFGWKPTIPPRVVYEDVSDDAWYAGAVEIAYREGAITDQNGGFRPDDLITRSEAASMLVRALGYSTIAGLVQDFPHPFQDVRANSGYISMVYGLGLMDGTSVTVFSPNDTITREHAAVILMRLYDKIHSGGGSRTGLISSAEDLPGLKGYESVSISAAHLVYNGAPQISPSLEDRELEEIRDLARTSGARQLLHVSGGPYQLREGGAAEMADVLLEAVKDGKYDGLTLEISGLTTTPQRKELTAVVEAVRQGLGEKLLYIIVEAPAWKGAISGYDYAALGETADRVILRVGSPAGSSANGTPTSPPEPLEEVYYALSRMRGLVDAGKLSLMVSASGTAWEDDEAAEPLTGTEIQKLLEDPDTRTYYSGRYASAYSQLESPKSTLTVWYLNGPAIQERVRLARLFGVEQLCLSELSGVMAETAEAMP